MPRRVFIAIFTAFLKGFGLGALVTGIVLNGLIAAVLFQVVPNIYIFEGWTVAWIETVNHQVNVAVREPIVYPSLALGLGNAFLAWRTRNRRTKG